MEFNGDVDGDDDRNNVVMEGGDNDVNDDRIDHNEGYSMVMSMIMIKMKCS